jgi:hypothetical protein
MIAHNDEFLHDAGSSSDWEEKYQILFVDKKAKSYGFAELNLCSKGLCGTDWLFFIDGQRYAGCETSETEHKPGAKAVAGKGIKYKINAPDSFAFAVKAGVLDTQINVASVFPAFDFPFSPGKAPDAKREEYESHLFKHYEQRCRASGSVLIKNGASKNFDCAAQREHLWGSIPWKNLTAFSRFHVMFKDMTISLVYLNLGGTVVSNGFISRKSGNIPIIDTALEHIEVSRDKILLSSEMSYRDSQDDKDLIVSTVLFREPAREVKQGKKKFHLFRSFSEFVVIGANKKGIGFEEHYIVPDRIGDFVSEK